DGFVLKGLTYGSLDPKFAERILNNAYTITRQAVLHITDKPIEIDRAFFQMPIPPGAEQVKIIVNEILKTYPLSLMFPQFTYLLLSEVFLKQRRTGGWLRRIFPFGDIVSRLELTKFFLKQLCDAEACPTFLLDHLQISTENSGKLERASSDSF